MIKKVVIIGPESTGKSTICHQLAAHYNTLYCPEYAREYLTNLGRKYTYEDLLTIAKGQLRLEDEFTEKAGKLSSATNPTFLFVDTDMYVMKVWCEFVFGQCHQWILDRIAERTYDFYFLCKPDLPWVKDDLREYPDETNRLKLYHFYKDLMVNQSTPWAEISGNYGERLQKAIDAVDELS